MSKALRAGILMLAWLGWGCPGTPDGTDNPSDGGTSMGDMASAGDMATGASRWPRQFGDSMDQLGTGVAVDHQNNVIVVGNFVGSADFGGGVLKSAGSNDVFIAKYSADGTFQWAKRFGSTYEDWVGSVAIDKSNDILIAGYFTGNTNFGGLGINNQGGQDVFVAKYGPDGVHLWSTGFGDTGNEEAIAVAVDASDNVIVSGTFDNSVNFGGTKLTTNGSTDTFLLKLTPAGAHSWSSGYGGSMTDQPAGLAVDASGNIFLSATFTGMSSFGGTAQNSSGGSDVMLAKYSSDGTHLWSTHYGGSGTDASGALATDSSGNVISVGSFQGTATFGGSSLMSMGQPSDVFFAKYSPDGTHLWSKRLGGPKAERAYSVTVDRNDNIFIAGSFDGTVNFGGSDLVTAGADDMWIGKFSSDSTHIWSAGYGGPNIDEAIGIQPDASGGAVAVGYFQDTATITGTSLKSAGGWDIAVFTHSP